MKQHLLPHAFKMVGSGVFILAFLIPIIIGMLHPGSWEAAEPRRQMANAVMLIGLLIFILSREKVEDEFVDFCRLRAFRVALVAGILYFLQDAFGTFGGNLLHSSFGLLVMEIGVYILVFHFLKGGWKHDQ